MNILVACEISGQVRDAFRAKGHEAWSCDLLGPDDVDMRDQAHPWAHYEGDCRDWLENCPHSASGLWDMIIAFPPCDHLAVSGARWFPEKRADGRQQQGIDLFMTFVKAKASYKAIENPISIMSTLWRKPDQIVHPWMFWAGEPGKGEVKSTCLWLENLPKLVSTTPDETGRIPGTWKMGPSPDRAMKRSATFPGIAQAFADQWGRLEP